MFLFSTLTLTLTLILNLDIPFSHLLPRLRPYHVEWTGSRPITAVNQRRARLVLGWVTAWESRVL